MSSHISDLEARKVLHFAQRVRDTLKLNYRIILSDNPPDDPRATAAIERTDGRFLAVLFLGTDWERETEDEKINSIVHEMIHILHFHAEEVLLGMLSCSDNVSSAEYHLFQGLLHTELEFIVDRLATVIVNGYDMPWPTDEEVQGFVLRHTTQGERTT